MLPNTKQCFTVNRSKVTIKTNQCTTKSVSSLENHFNFCYLNRFVLAQVHVSIIGLKVLFLFTFLYLL